MMQLDRFFSAALLLMVLLSACSSSSPSETNMKTETTSQEWHISGTAQNGKAGAIVLSDSLGPVYLEGLDAFPPEVIGKMVEAWGIRKVEDHDPQDLKNEQGEWKQGMAGEQILLRNANWKLKE